MNEFTKSRVTQSERKGESDTDSKTSLGVQSVLQKPTMDASLGTFDGVPDRAECSFL